ncbi:hypothetical protein AAHE18_09G046400 [Arachis hypogaea]
MLMSSHMMTNSKAYLSFLIFASLLSSHVLTHELSEGSYGGYHFKNFQWTMPSELPKAKKNQYTTYSLGYFLSGRRLKRRRMNPSLRRPHRHPLDSTSMVPLPTPPPISVLNHWMVSYITSSTV